MRVAGLMGRTMLSDGVAESSRSLRSRQGVLCTARIGENRERPILTCSGKERGGGRVVQSARGDQSSKLAGRNRKKVSSK